MAGEVTFDKGYYLVYPTCMAKLSIYVSDELWDRARQASGDRNSSQLVQEALADWTDARTAPRFSSAPAPAERERLAEIRERMRQEARDTYARGYRAGVEVASRLNWQGLDQLAEADFDLAEWVRRAEDPRLDENPASGLLFVISDWQFGAEKDTVGAGPTYDAGLVRALRDVWESVMADDPGAAETPGDKLPASDAGTAAPEPRDDARTRGEA